MPDSPVKDSATTHPDIAPVGPKRSVAAGVPNPEVYFRKGFGLKAEVQEELASDYNGRLVDLLREREFALTAGDVTVRLAREFGFCYGVERAVDYAYQTRRKFPDRRVFLAGEIIHNPHVNAKLQEMGVEILNPSAPGAGGLRISTPISRSFAFTCGLWMISPARKTRRSGNFRRV